MVIAVIDVGKTSLKLATYSQNGERLSLETTSNTPVPSSYYLEPDVPATWSFILQGLSKNPLRHAITDVIASGHGSCAYAIDGEGDTLPLPDYESSIPDDIDHRYRDEIGPPEEIGSGVSPGASHVAKQLFWLQEAIPERFTRIKHVLFSSQYWAWRLSGVMSAELTSLTAQSHLWNARMGHFTSIVGRRSWTRFFPHLFKPADVVGTITETVARQTGLNPGVRVHCGVHDSTANFYRFQTKGFRHFCLLSGGTWLVTMSDMHQTPRAARFDVTDHISAQGSPFYSVRSMVGREFDNISGRHRETVAVDQVIACMRQGVMALPSFVNRDGYVAGSAGRGRIVGNDGHFDQLRPALGLLYYALIAHLSLHPFPPSGAIVVDGNIASQPVFGSLIAALNRARDVCMFATVDGTLRGAALLAGAHIDNSTAIELPRLTPNEVALVTNYARTWTESVHREYEGRESHV
jgi:sugar (pentulose or hexulose) kinase